MAGKPLTFVLVHGAWHGGWCWREVADILRAEGHRVFTPTQTGLGERKHLMSRAITLDTFTDDIANVLACEDLHDVILVGHSFGGLAISGVADRMPERLRHLIYLDSRLVEPGWSPYEGLTLEVARSRTRASMDSSDGMSLPPPSYADLGIFKPEDIAKVEGRLVPHPFSTYTSALNIKGPLGNGVPCTYVLCTAPVYAPLESSRELARKLGWPFEEIATGHDAMVTAPEETARLFLKIAG